jgi:hypothetical protein
MRLEFFLVFVSPNIDCLALLFNLNRRGANGAFSGLQRISPFAQSIKVCSGKRAYKSIDAPLSAVATQTPSIAKTQGLFRETTGQRDGASLICR